MMKKIFITLLNYIIYILCFAFSLSSFFCILSFLSVEEAAFGDGLLMAMVFISGIIFAFVTGHLLDRFLLMLRLPVKEWKNFLLKQ